MRIYLKEQLAQVEQNMIEHFNDHNIGDQYDSIYLTEKDYFPRIEEIEYDGEFAKWFYYFQGQYHTLIYALKFIEQ